MHISEPVALPPELELLILSDKLIYAAKVQWQKGTEAGLSFGGPPQRAPLSKL